jgi:signal transduction histidine kinase
LNQLAQVVTNLLANAINFTSAGYVSLCTNLGEDGTVNFQMIDSGVGIDEVDMPHLFERFYRGRLTGESDLPGTGLGLAIVKEIVDMHHGRITVRSVVDSGSTFDIWLSVNGGRDISQIDDDA